MLLLRKKSKLKRMDSFQKFLLIVMTLGGIFMLLPIFYIFNHALKPYHELFLYPPTIFVRQPTLQNMQELLNITKNSIVPISRYLFNSIFVSAATVLLVMVISALCAYPISKHQFPGHKLFFGTILLSLMFAPETVAIPRYLIAVNLGINNHYMGHILPHLAAPVGVFLLKQFIDQIPKELFEAAKVDGANEHILFARIVLPMVGPAIATVAIITFQGVWGDTQTSTLFMQEESMKTFPFFLNTLTSNLANNVARQGAAAVAALILFLPNFLFFLFFQRKVIETMAHSGIK